MKALCFCGYAIAFVIGWARGAATSGFWRSVWRSIKYPSVVVDGFRAGWEVTLDEFEREDRLDHPEEYRGR